MASDIRWAVLANYTDADNAIEGLKVTATKPGGHIDVTDGKGGKTTVPVGAGQKYLGVYPTFDEAKAALVADAIVKAKAAQDSLSLYRSVITKANTLKQPVVFDAP